MKVIEGIKLYTVEETCEMLGITSPTLYTWFKNKKMIKTKIGGRTYVKSDSIKDVINKEL